MQNELDVSLLRRLQNLVRHFQSGPRMYIAAICAMTIFVALQFSRWSLSESIDFRKTHPDKFGMDPCSINGDTVLNFFYFQMYSSYGVAAIGIVLCLISKPKISIAVSVIGLIGLRAIALSSRLC
jgi:hypothetical protein